MPALADERQLGAVMRPATTVRKLCRDASHAITSFLQIQSHCLPWLVGPHISANDYAAAAAAAEAEAATDAQM